MLVEEGKLTWDKPVRESVPAIRFYDDELNNTVTLRDMLAHRTGITRHDTIWYKSDFTRKELFDRLKYLEPSEPLRQTFLYNNLMYAATGYIIELQSGKTWEEFVRERIFTPLGMTSTVYSIADMLKAARPRRPLSPRSGTASSSTRSRTTRTRRGSRPAGAIISNIRGHFALADGPDERREVRGQAGPPGRRAQGDARAGHRPPQHHGRDAGLLGDPEPGLRDGP